ncbi:MAG TPA: Nramp family divalent metal transporter, partial [Gemmatimonadaceae bacterium]
MTPATVDERILSDIRTRLALHPAIDATIQLIVVDREVTLLGTASSVEAGRLARAVAESTSGVTRVNDKLQYAAGPSPRSFSLVRFWRALGPGIVTGAADDDPSGIATYSIAGAQLGTTLLWTALFTWPLMAAVQSMCARIGMVTGRGLMAVLSRRFPRPVLAAACIALFAANTLNVGADLSAMADAAQLLTGISSHLWTIAFGAGIAWATIQLRYRAIADALKWLALVLFVYIAAAIQTGPDWSEVVRATAWPSFPHTRPEWTTLVAILGTTISPYLFFWQTSQEVEEEKAIGRTTIRARRRATREELGTRKVDIGVGTLLSNVAMFFIILTTAMTLHRAGLKDISTSREVAQALRPLAGRFAT